MNRSMDFKLFVATLGTVAVLARGASWDYGVHGPDTWGEHYPDCAKDHQSPINIKPCSAKIDCNLPAVDREIFSTPPTRMEITNNGHSIVTVVQEGAYVINNPRLLPFDAQIAQWHFHWGNGSEGHGSEHTLNKKQYFGELHAVHYNTKYKSISEAIDKPDGLAVFGWFIDVNYPQPNQNIKMFLDIARAGAKHINDATPVTTPYSLETLLPPNLDEYFRYRGSLTTPGCFQSVTWTVFKEPIQISREQADLFATSFFDPEGALIEDNFRPVQPLNGRAVTKSAPRVQSCKPKSKKAFQFIRRGLHAKNQ